MRKPSYRVAEGASSCPVGLVFSTFDSLSKLSWKHRFLLNSCPLITPKMVGSWLGVPCFNLSETYLTTGTAHIYHDIEICQVLWPSDQFFIGLPPHSPERFPDFSIVRLISLKTPKRIESITWDWTHYEDILEEIMVNFQYEGLGVPRDPTGAPKDQKWQKWTKILIF